ncbi:DotA/TraY family protein [Paracoccus sp. ME4]|uniref:DotA/TraY family protein n=1 Tax=Paracoccus sp. ME4 TaxID=3138066 RepID=UPI00398A5F00
MKILDWRGHAAILACIAAALLLTGGGALAQTQTPTPMETAAMFGTDYGDAYTSTFLNQIFGPLFPSATVSVGAQTVPTVFSTLIGYFNVVCLVLGGMLLFWNITIGVMQSAHEGVILGQRWSSLWAPIRVVFAVGLLVPIPGMGGYNVAQSGVAYLVRGSTNIASSIWTTAATLVINGEAPISIEAPDISTSLFESILMNEACIAILNGQVARAASYSSATANTVVRATENTDGGVIENTTYMLDEAGERKIRGVCGTVSTPAIPQFINSIEDSATATGIPGSLKSALVTRFSQAHSDVVDGLTNGNGGSIPGLRVIAGQMAQDAMASGASDPKRDYSAEFVALYHYVNDRHHANINGILDTAIGADRTAANTRQMMLNRITGANCTTSAGTADGPPVQCYGEGWIGAGSWYMMLAQLNNELSTLTTAMPTATMGSYITRTEATSNDIYVSTGANPGWGWFGWGADDAVEDGGFATASEVSFWMAKVQQVYELSTSGLAALGFQLSPKVMEDMLIVGRTDDGGSLLEWIPGLKPMITGALNGMINWTSPSNWASDPMIGMTIIGDWLIAGGWALMIVAIKVSSLAGIANLFIATGSTMAIILPLMPFFFWIMAVSGYFLLIVEAVVAVNLWAIGHMRMDGDGVSGDAGRQGWLMLLSLTMTPILMIFGFIVGMTLFRVTTSLVDVGINNVAAALLNATIPTMITGILVISVAMTVIYIVIIERSFSLVSEFPGKVLRWMGADSNVADGGEGRVRGAMAAAAAGTHQAAGAVGRFGIAGIKGGASAVNGAAMTKLSSAENGSPKSAGQNDGGSGGPKGDGPGGAPGGGNGGAPAAAASAGNNDTGAGGPAGAVVSTPAAPAAGPAGSSGGSAGQAKAPRGGRASRGAAGGATAGRNDGGGGIQPSAQGPAQSPAQGPAQAVKGDKGDAGTAAKDGTEGRDGRDGADGTDGPPERPVTGG